MNKFLTYPATSFGKHVCRLGLATRGGAGLTADDVHYAIDTDAMQIPVIAYTALRWGALLRGTPTDPAGFAAPPAPEWYRFVLQSLSVAVVLAAPNDRRELEQDLQVLTAREPLSESEYSRLSEHGDRVRQCAGQFP